MYFIVLLFNLKKVLIVLFQQILILVATEKISFAQLSHVSIILSHSGSMPLVFILALCIRIHIYTIHSLAAIG